MATVPSKRELEIRVRALERRSERHDEDIVCLVDTTSETLERVKGIEDRMSSLERDVSTLKGDVSTLKGGMAALLAHHGITVPAQAGAGEVLADG